MRNSSEKIRGGLLLLLPALALTAYFLTHTHHKTEDVSTPLVMAGRQANALGPASRPQDMLSRRDFDVRAPAVDRSNSIAHPGDRMDKVLKLRDNASPESIRTLKQFLEDSDHGVVAEAVDALVHIGVEGGFGEEVLNILEEKARDASFIGRRDALLGAATIGKDRLAPMIGELLAEGSENGNEELRAMLANALTLINSPICVPHLEVLLSKAENPETRRNCYETLAGIGSAEALSLLEKGLSSSKDEDQAASIMALARLDRPEMGEKLSEALKNDRLGPVAVQTLVMSEAAPVIISDFMQREDVNEDQRLQLLKNIASFSTHASGPVRESIAEALEPYIDSPDKDIQVQAIRGLGQLAGKRSGDVLLPKLYAEDPQVREAALQAFVAYTTPKNYTALLDLLWDPNEKTRRTAMWFAQKFVNTSDREIMERAMEHDDPFIREHAANLLAQIK